MAKMDGARIDTVFPHNLANLTAEQITHAVAVLLTRPDPSSFAVTADNGKYKLRLSNPSYNYLQEKLNPL